jgi:Fe2+ or Zn2+ uptake regulation protein
MKGRCAQKMNGGIVMSDELSELTRGMKEAKARLRGVGYKLTSQRLAILRLFVGGPVHLSAQQVWATLEPVTSKLSRATVYNTLEVLEGVGVVVRVQGADGQVYFDSRVEPHHHACCVGCGALFDVQLANDWVEQMGSLRGALPSGFRVESAALRFHGVCERCAAIELEEAFGA